MLLRVLASLAIIYLLLMIGLYLLQRNIIYQPSHRFPDKNYWGVPEFSVIDLVTDDGLALKSWYRAALPGKPTLVYYHGNGGHMGYRGQAVRPYLDAGYGVLMLNYRGYADNPGKPSEAGLYKDARASLNFLKEQGIQPECVILYGESLGAAIAIQMAMEQPIAGVALQAPFTNLPETAKIHYPYMPVKYLLKESYDSLAKIPNINAPILIMHGEQDRIVPPQLGRRLYEAANHPKRFILLSGQSHNNMNPEQLAAQVFEFGVGCQ